MKKTLLLFCCFVVIMNGFHIQAQNLLTNPGFETWTTGVNVMPIGWTTTNSINISQNTTLFTEGTKSIRVAATNADFTISQDVAVTPGKTYTLKISYYMESVLGIDKDLRISCNFRTSTKTTIKLSLEDSLALKGPGGNAAYFTTETGSWKTYTYDVVAPANSAAFSLSTIVSIGATISLDNFSFAENTLPTVYTNKTTLTGFTYTPGNGPSTEQTFTVKGNNLTSSITIAAPANYEISVFTGASFVGASTLTVTQSGGIVNTMTIYTRLKAGLTQNTYNGDVTISSTGTTSILIVATGFVTPPPVFITPSVTSLTGFTYVQGSGPSVQKSLTVAGSGLMSGIVVTAPTNYEISVFSGTYFSGTPTLTLAQTGGNVASTTIYVRLKSGLPTSTYNGTLTLSATGGTTQNISLTGSVTAIIGINVSTSSLTGLSYLIGAGPSAEQSFMVSGTGLTSFVIVTSPASFEMSTETGATFFPTNQVVIQQTGGVVPATTIYIRLMKGLAINTYTGNVSASSTGFTTQNIALNGNVQLGTAIENAAENTLKVYGNGSEIIVEGTTNNETVRVYNLVGMQLKSVQSTGERISIPVSRGGVYLVQTTMKTMKVVL